MDHITTSQRIWVQAFSEMQVLQVRNSESNGLGSTLARFAIYRGSSRRFRDEAMMRCESTSPHRGEATPVGSNHVRVFFCITVERLANNRRLGRCDRALIGHIVADISPHTATHGWEKPLPHIVAISKIVNMSLLGAWWDIVD